MNLVGGSLSVRNDSESSFHHCGGPVKLVHTCLSVRKESESSHRTSTVVNLAFWMFPDTQTGVKRFTVPPQW